MENSVKTEEIIDYAMPLMNIERMAKEVHDICLRRGYKEAQELTLKLGAEARLLLHTLKIMQEKEER